MKSEYGKNKKQYPYEGGKGYQATTGKENRNPNTPSQGGLPKTGGDFGKNKTTQYQPNKPTTPGQGQGQKPWGTGSINTDDRSKGGQGGRQG